MTEFKGSKACNAYQHQFSTVDISSLHGKCSYCMQPISDHSISHEDQEKKDKAAIVQKALSQARPTMSMQQAHKYPQSVRAEYSWTDRFKDNMRNVPILPDWVSPMRLWNMREFITNYHCIVRISRGAKFDVKASGEVWYFQHPQSSFDKPSEQMIAKLFTWLDNVDSTDTFNAIVNSVSDTQGRGPAKVATSEYWRQMKESYNSIGVTDEKQISECRFGSLYIAMELQYDAEGWNRQKDIEIFHRDQVRSRLLREVSKLDNEIEKLKSQKLPIGQSKIHVDRKDVDQKL